jgi:hypothetical protein
VGNIEGALSKEKNFFRYSFDLQNLGDLQISANIFFLLAGEIPLLFSVS